MPYRAILKEDFQVDLSPLDTGPFTGRLLAQIPKLDEIWGHGNTVGLLSAWWVTYQDALVTAANDDWDLRALLAGPEGSVQLAEVRAILMYSDTDLALLPHPTTNPWTALGAAFSIPIKAGTYFRYFCKTDGKLPVSGTDKVLRVANTSGATAAYSLAILGTLT